jgi:hypothetical protein
MLDEVKELFIRLMMRKLKTERVDKLSYGSIKNVSLAAETLAQSKFITRNDSSLEELMKILSKDELLKLAKARKVDVKLKVRHAAAARSSLIL